jgi:hypothetical protein
MVSVEMSHHNPANIARPDAESSQLRADLHTRLHPPAEGADAGMPAGEVALLRGAGRLTRVDDDHALGMLDAKA